MAYQSNVGATRTNSQVQWLLTKTRRALVSLGSAIIIFVLAFDPFVQQVVGFRSGLAYYTDERTVVPRALRYSKGMRIPPAATSKTPKGLVAMGVS